MRQRLGAALRRAAAPLTARLDRRIDARLAGRGHVDGADPSGGAAAADAPAPAGPSRRLWVPPVESIRSSPDDGFMEYATCSAADVVHPEFARICGELGDTPHFHRKLWEYVYLHHQLERRGMLRPGRRGLGFGVGREPLVAAFAARGCQLVATDAPDTVAEAGGWDATGQYAGGGEWMNELGLCDPDEFRERVEHRFVDMNAIDVDLTGFDFCWSSCCFEHLGSLAHGTDFVLESVERCLRPGGVAVHTTEFNLSSDDDTIEMADLSVYRRRDLEALARELRGRGHSVSPISVAPDAMYLDHYVDLPPYHGEPHLKLELLGHVVTSIGLVVEKGAG